jgi:hypothetical protein
MKVPVPTVTSLLNVDIPAIDNVPVPVVEMLPDVVTACVPKSGLIFVPAMAAVALTSSFIMGRFNP